MDIYACTLYTYIDRVDSICIDIYIYIYIYGKESVATAAGEVKVDNATSAQNFALASRN